MIKSNFQVTPKNTNKCFNMPNLKHPIIRNKYKNEIVYVIDNQNPPTDNQNSLSRITTMLKQAAENTIDFLSKNPKNLQMKMSKNSLYFKMIIMIIPICMKL